MTVQNSKKPVSLWPSHLVRPDVVVTTYPNRVGNPHADRWRCDSIVAW